MSDFRARREAWRKDFTARKKAEDDKRRAIHGENYGKSKENKEARAAIYAKTGLSSDVFENKVSRDVQSAQMTQVAQKEGESASQPAFSARESAVDPMDFQSSASNAPTTMMGNFGNTIFGKRRMAGDAFKLNLGN